MNLGRLWRRLLSIVLRRALPVPVVELVEVVVDEFDDHTEDTTPGIPAAVVREQQRQMHDAATKYPVKPPSARAVAVAQAGPAMTLAEFEALPLRVGVPRPQAAVPRRLGPVAPKGVK